jgi:hypothetical protein
MKLLLLLLISFIQVGQANVCICQYPKEDAKYGGGYRGEIGFYKMGCALWILSEGRCRKKKVIDINMSLDPYLNKVLKPQEKVKIGFVGHWSSSEEFIEYLQSDIEPLLKKYDSSFEVENTACSSMDEPAKVQDYLTGLQLNENKYINVEGSQTTSIGMWDKLSIGFRKADLIANGDSRGLKNVYPLCKKFINRRCTGFQEGETGYCQSDSGVNRKLICHGKIKTKLNSKLKLKQFKRWLYLDETQNKVKDLIKQTEQEIIEIRRGVKL